MVGARDRTWPVRAGHRWAADRHRRRHSFELTLPGNVLAPAAGVTAVGVLPSHRRRGVLAALMRRRPQVHRRAPQWLWVRLLCWTSPRTHQPNLAR
ncbi:GNAT family N-acetyltransferase [Amycolatopsis jejuensis]|uniref:GNAT family N-acetyltransferase n=1 Tax=Amycolatopsis jejuensis TaxID=330084 RepID=UPI001FE0F29D|nr:GNAT family N-acetyltransferase [Amycolatopsis jejuensis]